MKNMYMYMPVMLLLASGGTGEGADGMSSTAPAPKRSSAERGADEISDDFLRIQQRVARTESVISSKASGDDHDAVFDELIGEAERPGSLIDPAAVIKLTAALGRLRVAGADAAVAVGLAIGSGTPPTRGPPHPHPSSPTPIPPTLPSARPLAFPVDVGDGGQESCDGGVKCGDGEEEKLRPVMPVTGLLAAGIHHTCATRQDGTVACWGRNQHGQSVVPPHVGRVSQIGVGWFHSCGVVLDGQPTVRCWGEHAASPSSSSALNLGVRLSQGTDNLCIHPGFVPLAVVEKVHT